MNKFLLRKTWLIMSSALLAGCSCSGGKPEKQPEKQEIKEEKSSEEKGPEQQPFKRCEAMDAECEEGASSDVLQKAEDTLAIEAIEESKEQVLFVTPIVIEAVKMELSNESATAVVQDSPVETSSQKEENVLETASASSPETSPAAE